ncbi:AAA family ATPase [Glutamicibacter protophormiae]|uniref:AAA family ATPase n=1 Tax=Glutamicibacter protophormiae TaxID=37930 RepID=UPI00195A9999|nr:AAA family ATPase [Glutamicibacter protophormiae]QRQ78328.1 AAA family ATPase [Glutamicibacter protophormiae]
MDGTNFPDSYTWLAYDFDNLILTCDECKFNKSNFFPVEGRRADSSMRLNDVEELENRHLINPYNDNISTHLECLFDGWFEPKTYRGKATISILNLNREELIAEREVEARRFAIELMELFNSSSAYDRLENVIDYQKEFAGVRLNILKRILKGSGLTNKFQSINFPFALNRKALGEVSENEKRRVLQQIEDLPGDDSRRRRWDGAMSVSDTPRPRRGVSPWSRVERNGGLSNIEINNFKGISALKLEISPHVGTGAAPCLMLLGENSVGKTSVLQAIALALLGASEAKRLKLKSRDFLSGQTHGRWDQLTPPDPVTTLSFRFGVDAIYHYDAGQNEIIGEDQVRTIVLGYGPRRYFDPLGSKRTGKASARVVTLFNPKATIPHPGSWLSQLSSEEFAQVAQVIRAVLSLKNDDRIVRSSENLICIEFDGQPIPLERLSDGYKSVISMVVDIVRELLSRYPIIEEAEAIVLIDEIETHLHPRLKMRIMSALRDALPRVQFIATTHDPLCLHGMDDGEVVVLQRMADGAIRKLENLPSVKGMRADQLLTSDYFGLSSTTDPATELSMARYVQAVSSSPEGLSLEADRLISHLTMGNDSQERVIREAMGRFIAERERPVERLRPEISGEAVDAVLNALRNM